MSALLIIILIILVAIAIRQLAKMFELSQLHVETSQVASDKDNKINGYLMFAFLVFIYLLTIYSLVKWGKVTLAEPASEHGKELDRLMAVSLIIIFFVQTVTQALLHYFAYKYSGRKGRKALFYADNNRLEFIWTIIPVIVLAGLILYGLYTWTDIMNVDDNDDDLIVIELYAQQFNWTARYAGKDHELGKANVRFIDIDKANTLGVDETDPYSADDIIVKELHLPVNRKVLFKMRSQDVLHSAYMPHFRAQMNCVPGMITQFAITPTVTTEQMRLNPSIQAKVQRVNELRAARKANGEDVDFWEFDYVLLCNKICGPSHYNMQMKIIVETEEQFNEWLQKQPTFGSSLTGQ
jgi:cytochrome c oxidase subunit 2